MAGNEGHPISLAALTCGIFGFLLYFVGGFTLDVVHDVGAIPTAGIVLGLVAVVLGLIGRKREVTGRRWATTGLALGALVIVWLIGFIVLASTGVITDAGSTTSTRKTWVACRFVA